MKPTMSVPVSNRPKHPSRYLIWRRIWQPEETLEHRNRRLWFHGPDAFQRLQAGQRFFRSRVSARVEGGLWPDGRRGQGVRRELGLRVDRDRVAQIGRTQGYRRDRHLHAEQYPRRDCPRRGRRRQDDPLRETLVDESRRGAEDGRCRREGRGAEHGLVQLSPDPGRDPGQGPHRCRQVGEDLPLPRQLPPGLDDLGRSAPGRHRDSGGSTSPPPAPESPATCWRTASIRPSGSTVRSIPFAP